MRHNRFILLIVVVALGPVLLYSSAKSQQLCINEIMQSNINTVFADMDFPDSWVEIYNPTIKGVCLDGFCIGISANYKECYTISTTDVVPAGGYMLLYLDKVGNGNHANFRLNSDDDGVLFFYDNNGTMLDSLFYPAMPAPNIAYARDSDGGYSWHYVCQPTPEASNTGVATDLLLPPPLFSIYGHVMTESEKLTISIPKETALPNDTRLYLTFDGSEPEKTATKVSGKDTTFIIDKTTVVRARLISDLALCPPSRTESYIFYPHYTNIPIISLATDEKYLYSDSIGIFSSDTIAGNTNPNYAYNWRRPLNMEYLGVVGDESLFNQLGETGMYGKSSRAYEQKSLKLIANKRFGKKHLSGYFWPEIKPNMKKVKGICLRSCVWGNRVLDGIMQNWFGIHIPNLDYQAYSPAIVYINGKNKGFMGLRERTDEDYVWANYNKLEDIEMIESLAAYDPKSFRELRTKILTGGFSCNDDALNLDIANTADMIAINTICTNTDWPYNNVVIWRPSVENGKWRWIMKDMDNIAKPFRCNDPVTFNYLKYLTNTGSAGSQESNIHLISSWISTHVEFLGGIVTMPGFSDYLVDKLMVYMGDFMRGDVVHEYLEEQFDLLNTEVSQLFLMLKTGGIGTFREIINSYSDFFYARPNEVYQHIADFFHLGNVIPMKTIGYGAAVSINDIPLTEGDFNGACFSNRAVRLNSGDEHMGWIMHIKSEDKTIKSCVFESSIISVIPMEYQTSVIENITCLEFETCPMEQISVSLSKAIPSQLDKKIDAIYTVDGKVFKNQKNKPSIIRYKDGTTKKLW